MGRGPNLYLYGRSSVAISLRISGGKFFAEVPDLALAGLAALWAGAPGAPDFAPPFPSFGSFPLVFAPCSTPLGGTDENPSIRWGFFMRVLSFEEHFGELNLLT